MKKGLFWITGLSVLFIIFLMLINPNVCKDGAVYGLILSSKVIIPSIFPFTVFVLYILNSEILEKSNFLTPITQKILGLNTSAFAILILSFIGGYPIGAKLLNQAVELKKTNKENATVMINYCVNAGPAFIILAVGSGILNSKTLGYILFVSHILSSFVLAIFSKKYIKPQKNNQPKTNLNIMDNFVLSVSGSASSTLSICSFIILFSVILNYINFYSQNFSFLKNIVYLLEVTNAVTQIKNVILISFLLGFGGICVWFQVFSMARNFKINYLLFILFRFIQGILSSGFTYIFLKVFKISAPTLSNGINAFYTFTGSTYPVAFSLICMGIILIISLYTKNYAGNLFEDLV